MRRGASGKGLLATLFASLAVSAPTNAEPFLHSPVQQVSYRAAPPPFKVNQHRGRFQWGYGHIEFVAPGGELRWGPWIDARYIKKARAALALVHQRAVSSETCNRYFADNMPGGKTLREIWNAQGKYQIRISYSNGPSALWRAATYANASYEWTITESTVLLGAESIAAAMVHEATRTNGVTHQTRVAYGAANACGVQPFVLSKLIARRLGWSMRVKQ